jgi:flagellar hook-basal body complex protein FliE
MRPVSLHTVELPSSGAPRTPATEGPRPGGFTESLQAAVATVDALQLDADAESSKLAQGGGNLHETMLALEKADVGMRVAMKVRNKIIDAYNEVMRMSV